MGAETRRAKSLRIGVHIANAVVWGPVYRTRLFGLERVHRRLRVVVARVRRQRRRRVRLRLLLLPRRGVRLRAVHERCRVTRRYLQRARRVRDGVGVEPEVEEARAARRVEIRGHRGCAVDELDALVVRRGGLFVLARGEQLRAFVCFFGARRDVEWKGGSRSGEGCREKRDRQKPLNAVAKKCAASASTRRAAATISIRPPSTAATRRGKARAIVARDGARAVRARAAIGGPIVVVARGGRRRDARRDSATAARRGECGAEKDR